ncbi:MAG: hypothetical protein B6D41_00550 [Chloroflexi bacterium UTCFX4]|nr:MAG: hypothetical protein B6D41_00550 [Chloroflexi bacterium UTCFX4]
MNTTEIAVIGAGPAGIAAAVTAANAGARVLLLDENPRPGGQYYKQPPSSFHANDVASSLSENIQHGRELIAGLNNPKITVCANTLVWNITADGILDLYAPEGATRVQAKRIILASGAYERVVPFAGWTLPGVMTVGAAQLMLKGQGLLVGQKILLCGTGPLLQLAAVQLLDAGADIAALVELHSRTEFFGGGLKLFGQWGKIGQGMAQQKKLLDAGVPMKYGCVVTRAVGETETRGAVIVKVDGNGRPIAGSEETIAADTICMNYGFVPATELARLAGCEQFFDTHFDAFATKTNDDLETTARGIFAAGEVRGIGGVEVALLEGKIAGAAAARQFGYAASSNGHDVLKEWQKARAAFDSLSSMFAVKRGVYESIADDVLVCRCEEIRAGEIRDAARAGAQNLNALKAWNRCGMGRCQGRICGPIAAQLIASETGTSVESVGAFTARIPVKPVPLGVVGASAEPHATGTAMEDHVGYGAARVK